MSPAPLVLRLWGSRLGNETGRWPCPGDAGRDTSMHHQTDGPPGQTTQHPQAPQLTTATAVSAARDVQLRSRASSPQHSTLGERQLPVGSRPRPAGGGPRDGCHPANLQRPSSRL